MRNLRKILQLILGVALIGILLSLIDVQEVYREIQRLNYLYYLLAVAVFLSIYLWSCLRWKKLSESIGYSISVKTSFKIIAVSYGMNKILPFNSGDLARSKIMERYTDVDSHGEIAGIVAIERLLDVIFLGLIVFYSSFAILGGLERFFWVYPAIFVLICMIFALRYMNSFIIGFVDGLEKLRIGERSRSFLKDGLRTFKRISDRDLSEILLWQCMRWISGITVTFMIAVSLGIPLSFKGSGLQTGISNLASVIPATPAGLGISELSGISSLVLIGLSSSEATSIVLLERILALFLMPVIGYLVYTLTSTKG